MRLDNLSLWVQLLGTLPLLLLGAVILLANPATRASRALGAFVVGFGFVFVLRNVSLLLAMEGTAVVGLLNVVARVGTTAALLYLLSRFPRTWSAQEARVLVLPGAIGLAVFLAGAYATFTDPLAASRPAENLAYFAMMGGVHGCMAALALRARALADKAERAACALTAIALALYAGTVSSGGPFVERATSVLAHTPLAVSAWVQVLSIVAIAALWVAASTRRAQSALMRNVSLAFAAMPLASLLFAVAMPDFPVLGVARLAAAAVLAYAVMRRQVLGLPVKVQLTLSRGFLTGCYVAVFLVASQIAQNLLTQQLGIFVGGAAAGLLLFALRPLDALSKRLASRVVPSGDASQEYTAFRKLEVYRLALESAWENGTVRDRERAALDRLRTKLGVDAVDTGLLEADVIRSRAGASPLPG